MRIMSGLAGVLATLAVFTATAVGAAAAEPADPIEPAGSITGKVLDADGKPVADVMVMLCQQSTGVPFVQGAQHTLVEAFLDRSPQRELAFSLSDDRGRFAFDKLPLGRYRLVAQSWRDAKPAKGLMEVHGELLELRGIAENVEVAAGASPEVAIRPLGTGILRLDEDMPNDWTVLVLSTSPPRADPILGWVGWGGPLVANLLGAHRMPKGKTTVYGLPEGKVHFVLFANDDSPGFGAGEANVKSGKITDAYAPIVAGWSDGRHDPPPRLVPLFNQVKSLAQEKDFSLPELLRKHGIELNWKGIMNSQAEISRHLSTQIELPDGTKTTFGDLMAIVGYLELQRAVERRQAQARARAGQPSGEGSEPTGKERAGYEETLIDLHRHLGQSYPCLELKKIDWQAVGETLLPQAKEVTTDEQFGLLCLELVARLEDSHAVVGEGTANPPTPPFPQWDPGFACLIDDRQQPVVYYVDGNSPAEAAGVCVGMTVLSVNGLAAGEAIQQCMQHTRKYWGYSSDRYLRYQAARWFPRQMERGAKVTVEVQSPDGKKQTLEMPATLGVRYLPRLPVPIAGVSDSGNVSWTMLDDQIGYIYVRRIRADLTEQLDRAVAQLKDARGMIVDVRGNSGGGFDASRAHRNFAPDDDQEPERPRFHGPMALVIDSRCISAGEGWASWFIAHRRARVFGEATAGASARKQTYTLKNGLYTVTFPVKAYRGFLSRPIERRGLEPDVPLRQSAGDLTEGRDTVLEAARTHLLGESSGSGAGR
ncbi:MAG: hypothetical protein JXB62_10020 [Pirellulales bacterium]|nr:hypothetical protein [Pirellulales bacterium]